MCSDSEQVTNRFSPSHQKIAEVQRHGVLGSSVNFSLYLETIGRISLLTNCNFSTRFFFESFNDEPCNERRRSMLVYYILPQAAFGRRLIRIWIHRHILLLGLNMGLRKQEQNIKNLVWFKEGPAVRSNIS